MSSGVDRLSRQDRRFLRHEAVSPMNIGALTVFAAGPLGRAPTFAAVRKAIAERLDLVPRLKQRLDQPRFGRARWEAVEGIDLDHHIRQVRLGTGVSREELDAFASSAIAEPLDFERPLWRVWFIEGLPEEAVAILFVVNHASMDGASGFFVLTQILGAEYTAEDLALVDAHEASKRPPTTRGEAFQREATSLAHLLRCGLPPRPSAVNGDVGPGRALRGLRVPLEEIQGIRAALGGSPTDVLLACVTRAVQGVYRRRGQVVAGRDIRVAVPANDRPYSDLPSLGNRVVGFQLPLPVEERCARRRLEQIQVAMRAWKATRGSRIARVLAQLTEGLWSRAVAWRIPGLRRVTFAHFIVSNCPPIPGDYDLLGAPLREVRPVLPLFAEQGLGIGAVAFRGELHLGFTADPDLVSDLDEIVEDVARALAELRLEAARVSGTQTGNLAEAA